MLMASSSAAPQVAVAARPVSKTPSTLNDVLQSTISVAFAQDSLTRAERAWLQNNRSDVAARWNLLTNISAEAVASGF